MLSQYVTVPRCIPSFPTVKLAHHPCTCLCLEPDTCSSPQVVGRELDPGSAPLLVCTLSATLCCPEPCQRRCLPSSLCTALASGPTSPCWRTQSTDESIAADKTCALSKLLAEVLPCGKMKCPRRSGSEGPEAVYTRVQGP